MSAPLIWIGLPALSALVFWFIRSRYSLVNLLAVLLSSALALIAALMPIGEAVSIGPLKLQVLPIFEFSGRRLVLDDPMRPFLVMVYLVCAFWFIGNASAKVGRFFNALALGIVALLLAALAVEPFLYAALLVEMAVLLSVPIFSPPGRPFNSGVLRFLIFQTLAMPFILLAGWALAQVEADPTNAVWMKLSVIFLGLGFAIWLAVFPFYSWIPMLAEQGHPYVSGFFLLFFTNANLMLGLKFLDRFGWLQQDPSLFAGLRLMGILMIGTAGLLAAFQKNLSRLFGYAVIVETGFSLLAVGLGNHLGNQVFAGMLLQRIFCFALWTLALSILRGEAGTTQFEDVEGLANRLPFASAGLALASLSVAGLPLLAAFPIRWVLMEELTHQSLVAGLAVLIGSVGVMFSTFRGLTILARGSLIPQAVKETRTQIFLLVMAMGAVILFGVLPRFFVPMMFPVLNAFQNLP